MLNFDKMEAVMPKLIKLYIVNVAIGFALSVAFLGLLLWQDVAGLRHLILESDVGHIAAFMMVVMNGVVFAVMRLAEDPEGPKGGTGAPDVSRLAPIKIAVRSHRA
jgi:hypothetical protein